MTKREGYGHDWGAWDAYLEHKGIVPPGEVRYGNWCPFWSPKGRLMAFYNKSYGDIQIIDLETKEVVVKDFYSRLRPMEDPERVYNHHTNCSTYVPSFIRYPHESKFTANNEERHHRGFSHYVDQEWGGKDDLQEWLDTLANKGGEIGSLPVAFNVWTIWACDYEQYLDAIDLRQVDDGIVKLWPSKKTHIPINATHVRNYVQVAIDHHSSEGGGIPDPDDVTVDFRFLEERWTDRISMKSGEFHFYDMYKAKWNEDQNVFGPVYEPDAKLPWQKTKERLDAHVAEREKAKGR
jgi:hypothetical protein